MKYAFAVVMETDIRVEPMASGGFVVVNYDKGVREVIEVDFATEAEAKHFAQDALNSCVEDAERAAGWDPRA